MAVLLIIPAKTLITKPTIKNIFMKMYFTGMILYLSANLQSEQTLPPT